MDVSIIDQQTALPIKADRVRALVAEVIAYEGHQCDEVAIHFVDVPTICQLHTQYFDDPSPTDCITFPIDDPNVKGYCHLGEVFVCPQVALDYVSEKGGDPYSETALYIVHGLLHLMGYGDIEEADVSKMRQAEERHMQYLSDKNILLTAA